MSTVASMDQREAIMPTSNGQQGNGSVDILQLDGNALVQGDRPATAEAHHHTLLPLQLLKCRTLRACCSGEGSCSSTALAAVAAKQLARYESIQDFTTSKGLITLGSAIAAADTTQPPSCTEIQESGATTCPAGGCPLPHGGIAESPEDLLRWNCSIKDVGHVILARSVVASEFGTDLFVAPGDKTYAFQDGAYQPISDSKLQRLVITHLGNESTIHIAKAIHKMILTIEARDAEVQPSPHHICFKNGTFDLATGRLGEHSIVHNLFNRIPHSYIPGSQCPEFMAFLGSIWHGDSDAQQKKGFIQEWLGLLLTADSSHQCMLILKGEGSNGKSVLMEIARQLVGEANTTSAMLDRLNVPHVRSTIDKKLLNQSADLPKLRQVADGDFKAIISGDSVEASAKYKPSATFKPYVRLMVATNNMPHSKDTTDGYFRRLIVLSFNRQFAESERDPNLLAKLKEEMPGIVAWAVEGARMLRERGKLSVPPSSNQEVRTYREELSPAMSFAGECLEASRGTSGIRAADLFSAFSAWCKAHGFSVGSSISLGRELTRLGFRSRKSGTTLWMLQLSAIGRRYLPNLAPTPAVATRQPTL